MKVLLILSSALCNPELQFMFGKLPASRIPVGGKSLIQHQLKMAADFDRIFITHPEDFPARPNDHRVTMLSETRSTDPRPLMEVLHRAVISIWWKHGIREVGGPIELHVLWGDTLVSKWAEVPSIGFAETRPGDFNWMNISVVDKHEGVFIGYFMADIRHAMLTLMHLSSTHLLQLPQLLADLRVNYSLKMQKYTDGADWFDFGHAATYFVSKQNFLSSRHFNHLEIKDNVVRKRGLSNKIRAEYEWYRSIPSAMRKHTPALLSETFEGHYDIEYLPLPTLAELYVCGNQASGWYNIIDKCLDFVEANLARQRHTIEHAADAFMELIGTKTYRRINQLRVDLSPLQLHALPVDELALMASECVDMVPRRTDTVSIVHGDLCFSNIAYDHRSNSLKVFDPRGLDGFDELSIYGDARYELAKLLHSLFGYDSIIAGDYRISALNPPPLNREALTYFSTEMRARFRIDLSEVLAVTALLFFSMLPLHSDSFERQLALYNMGREIYSMTKEPYSCAI